MGGFSNPLVGGGGALVYPSVHSPDFAAGGGPILSGTNATQWTSLTGAGVTGLSSAIVYIAQGAAGNVNGVPAAWPGGGQSFPAGVTNQIVDFAPDVATTLAGTNDTRLAAYFAAAPNNSWIMAYHEVNAQANINQFGYTPSQINQLDAHLQALVHAANPTLKYGRGFSTFDVYHNSQVLTPWVSSGADFYGMDGYQGTHASYTPAFVFGGALGYIRHAVPGATVGIIETGTALTGNDPATGKPYLNEWFNAIQAWAQANGIFAVQSFWGTQSNTQPWQNTFAGEINTVIAALAAGTSGAGWIIAKDGSAQLNNVTLRGTLTLTASGNALLIYSGTPALGNLIAAVTAAPGTDSFGNAYPGGIAALSFAGGTALTELFGAQRASTTGTTITGTTLTQVASVTVPAGTAVAGAVYRLTAWGNGTWNNGSGDTLVVQPSMGGSTAGGCTVGTVALTTGAFRWRLIQELTCLSTGTGATWLVAGHGSLTNFGSNIQNTSSIPVTYGNTATITADSTIAQAMTLSLAWGAIVSSPTITCAGFYAERVA